MNLELHLSNQKLSEEKAKRGLKKTFSINCQETDKMLKFNVFNLKGEYVTTVYVWKSQAEAVWNGDRGNLDAYQMFQKNSEVKATF